MSKWMNMKNEIDILADERLRKNPFSVPDGYVLELEDKVHRRIYKKEVQTPWSIFMARAKAPALLALTFGVIFAMGYGILSLTGTMEPSAAPAPGLAELIEQGYINSDFIEDYYDRIHPDTILDDTFSTMEMTAEMEEEIMGYITLDDIAGDYDIEFK